MRNIFYLFVLVFIVVDYTSAQWGSQYCKNDKLPVVLLHRNTTTGIFTLVTRVPANETNYDLGSFRRMRRKTFETGDVADMLGQQYPSHGWTPGMLLGEQNRGLQTDFEFGNELTETSGPDLEPTMSPTVEPQITLLSTHSPPNHSTMRDEYFYARECSCFDNYRTVYCPFIASVCQQPDPAQGDELPGCLTLRKKKKEARIFTYLTLIAFWIVGGLLVFTKYGQSAFDYPMSWCIRGWNRRRVRQMMREDPPRTAGLLRVFTRRRHTQMQRLALRVSHRTAWTEEQLGQQQQRQDLEQGSETDLSALPTSEMPADNATASIIAATHHHRVDRLQPTSFTLRTCRFHLDLVSSTAGYQEDLEWPCAICLDPLLEGECVGALVCRHVFHVDCLRTWLQQRDRNVCPLCKARQIATPVYGHENGRLDHKRRARRGNDENLSTDSSSNERSMQETRSNELASADNTSSSNVSGPT